MIDKKVFRGSEVYIRVPSPDREDYCLGCCFNEGGDLCDMPDDMDGGCTGEEINDEGLFPDMIWIKLGKRRP